MSETVVQTPHGTIRLDQTADGCIAILAGEHDLASAGALDRVLAAAREVSATTIVDLAETTFVDCSIIGVLVEHRGMCARAGGEVILIVPPGSLVRRVIELTHTDDVFAVVGSCQEVEPSGSMDGHVASAATARAADVSRQSESWVSMGTTATEAERTDPR
ncbi:MAG TPA: STAS domain-containing protein [Gaiellales bacterium]|jgi:anti-anti-sigma factor|nr:STAS domain-containing protein [Gaiellales bacterium]